MAANRIHHPRFAAQMTPPNPPQQPAGNSQPIPQGFAICPPVVGVAQPWQMALYRQAYEQAKAAVLVPRHHRLLFSVWN